jgi:hypothetical protein
VRKEASLPGFSHLQKPSTVLSVESAKSAVQFHPFIILAVDIPALKPIMPPVCIGTHSVGADGQAFPQGSFPPSFASSFSLFKIQNSQFPPLQSGPIKDQSGGNAVKQGKK